MRFGDGTHDGRKSSASRARMGGQNRLMTSATAFRAPPAPPSRLSLGVTGHRESNGAFAANRSRIEVVLAEVLDIISDAVKAEAQSSDVSSIVLHSMLAEGADLLAAEQALARGWELVSPLPFGLDLNIAINAQPATADDARALLSGKDPASVNVKRRADSIRSVASRARLFELADRDRAIAGLLIAGLQYPDDRQKFATFDAEASLRVELAARVMIEHSDLIVAIWDGVTRAFVGGTGYTIQMALETGAPVVWIDANAPDHWRILYGPESLAGVHAPQSPDASRGTELRALVRASMHPAPSTTAHGHQAAKDTGPAALDREQWRDRSNTLWHGYRRMEALFGADNWKGRLKNLRQTYETPDSIASGSAAGLLERANALPGQDSSFVASVERNVLRRFAWADGISAYLSDAYRGGMTLNFLLAPLGVVVGIAYLPFASSSEKWIFATIELTLLASIIATTLTGQRRRWHGRWFETRRVAEYLRHAPVMLLLGVTRPPGRWPKGAGTAWPEWYARRGLREVGLPQVKITQTYLRRALSDLLDNHVVQQRDYHRYKAKRLAAAHHNLDRLSEALFVIAVVSVSAYLLLKTGGVLHFWSKSVAEGLSYVFTFLGVAMPAFGGAIAGIRYFGDFERFSAISEVAGDKLSAIHNRIRLLLDSPEEAIDYGQVADLARAVDDAVIGEIEGWQAVFAGKHVAVPV